MRSASGHQCKVKMRGSEKNVNENTYDISSKKHVTGSFTFSVVQNDLLLFFHRSCPFAAWHSTILYFVSTNFNYYRELHF